MTDTKFLIHCPNCESFDIQELYGLYRTSREGSSEEGSREAEYKLFRCRGYGAEFDEGSLTKTFTQVFQRD